MTLRITDQTFLRNEQYNTSQNLNARIELHRRFSTNRQGWARWQFEQVDWRPGMRVLEVGCGSAHVWAANRDRIPANLALTLSDFSFGMVREAKAAAGEVASVCNLDVQQIPFGAAAFDVVVANHMLYHVPDIPRGLSELARVLRPGGVLHAATNGSKHLRELHHLMHDFEPGHDAQGDPFAETFGLENAVGQLQPFFTRLEVREYPDSLWVTDAQILADYAYSLTWGLFTSAAKERKPEFVSFLQSCLDRDGGIHIGKQSGVVIAYKPG